MAKIAPPQANTYTTQSDWEKDVWTGEDYQKHERDFENILAAFRDICSKNGGKAIEARREWMERQGAVRNGMVVASVYLKYRNMFDRFTDWLCFREQREGIKVENYKHMLDRNPDLVRIDPEVKAIADSIDLK